jgi:hypothetical protein
MAGATSSGFAALKEMALLLDGSVTMIVISLGVSRKVGEEREWSRHELLRVGQLLIFNLWDEIGRTNIIVPATARPKVPPRLRTKLSELLVHGRVYMDTSLTFSLP